MCMRNLNTNIAFAEIVTNQENSVVSLANIGKSFRVIEESDNNTRKIPQLSMVLFISATQTKNKELLNKANPDETFLFKEKYEIQVRLTETISGSFVDLGDSITISPSDSSEAEGLCRETYNHVQFYLFSNIFLPTKKQREKYVIKVLVRRCIENRMEDDGWVVQSISPINFITSI